MKIALIGYGKMGKAIEELALQKGHEIVLKIHSQNQHEFTTEQIRKADVCIEFTVPHSAFDNVCKCLQAGVPTVCGTTAWLDKLEDAKQICAQQDTALLVASNFSIGVNLFFQINEYVAKLMNDYPAYKVSMEEIHHTQKKDSPSGTAVTLAEGILKHQTHKTAWINEASEDPNLLSIVSKRIDPAPGTHSITYHSDIDDISITHTAHSRIGFASGALAAAEFLAGKKGIYSMKEVLGLMVNY
jgi:4-hydroxy-tetrahydrodipicolinate reductase